MIVGIPVPFSLQDTNVVEPSLTLEEYTKGCIAPIFGEGLLLQDGTTVFEYTEPDDFKPQIWKQTDETAGHYKMGDILWKDCKLIKVTAVAADSTFKPKEPEQYGQYDTGMDHEQWRNRYVRVSAKTGGGWLSKQWTVNGRLYYMFWEDRGDVNSWSGCNKGGTRGGWRWSAKDLRSKGERNVTMYLRNCLKKNFSKKFEVGKDVKATIVKWKGGKSPTVEETVQFQSVIQRGGYFYFRTHLNKPIEYVGKSGATSKYGYSDVKSPMDIYGFRDKRLVAGYSPFDGKNYTETTIQPESLGGYAKWTLLSSGEFDGIAFGHCVAEYINITFKDFATGKPLEEVNGFIVDNNIDFANPNQEYFSTFGIYATKRLPSETIIEIEMYGEEVIIGEILAIDTLDTGFTKATFKNKFRDFSPKEQDQWGNMLYREGVRVNLHAGTVEFPIMRYDQLNRLMLLVAGSKVFIDGSDAKGNERPDGHDIFEATQMIGRFTQFDLSATEKNKHIGDRGSYNFSFEEIV